LFAAVTKHKDAADHARFASYVWGKGWLWALCGMMATLASGLVEKSMII